MNLLAYATFSLLAVIFTLNSVQSLPTSKSFKGVEKSLEWHHGLFDNLRAGVQKSAHTLLHYQTEVIWVSFSYLSPPVFLSFWSTTRLFYVSVFIQMSEQCQSRTATSSTYENNNCWQKVEIRSLWTCKDDCISRDAGIPRNNALFVTAEIRFQLPSDLTPCSCSIHFHIR